MRRGGAWTGEVRLGGMGTLQALVGTIRGEGPRDKVEVRQSTAQAVRHSLGITPLTASDVVQ